MSTSPVASARCSCRSPTFGSRPTAYGYDRGPSTETVSGTKVRTPLAACAEPSSLLWMAQSVDDWHIASVYSYLPSAANRYVRTIAREPVESSQCWVSQEPTSSRGSCRTTVGTGGAGTTVTELEVGIGDGSAVEVVAGEPAVVDGRASMGVGVGSAPQPVQAIRATTRSAALRRWITAMAQPSFGNPRSDQAVRRSLRARMPTPSGCPCAASPVADPRTPSGRGKPMAAL